MDSRLKGCLLMLVALAVVVAMAAIALRPLLQGKPEPPPGPDDFVVQFGEAASRAADRVGHVFVGGITEATQKKLKEIVGADPEERVKALETEIKRLEEDAAHKEEHTEDDR